MKISALQMVANGTLEDNLRQAETLIAQAAEEGAVLAVLPEYFAYYGCARQNGMSSQQQTAQRGLLEHSAGGPVRSFLSQQARLHNLWLVGGTVPVLCDADSESRPHAASFVVNNQGEEVGCYHKMHLFDVDVDDSHGSYRESRDYCPGTEPVVVDSPVGRLGLSVCYDLRFPELYRKLALAGAEVLLVPSAFTRATGEAHWRLLLQARAVENLCYVVGANMGDRGHPSKPTWGGSAIVDPWGEVLAECEGGAEVVTANIDLARVAELRRNMPVLKHSRLKIS